MTYSVTSTPCIYAQHRNLCDIGRKYYHKMYLKSDDLSCEEIKALTSFRSNCTRNIRSNLKRNCIVLYNMMAQHLSLTLLITFENVKI